MITKKVRIFVTRPMQFVIVTFETITLLWSFHAWSAKHQARQATDDPRETFFRMWRELNLLMPTFYEMVDEMLCRMVLDVCWWCACRASGGAHLVCAWCSVRVCVARCTFWCRRMHIFVVQMITFRVVLVVVCVSCVWVSVSVSRCVSGCLCLGVCLGACVSVCVSGDL